VCKLFARNILYLQSKITALQAKQDEYDEEDYKENDIRRARAACCWEDFESDGCVKDPKAEMTPAQKRYKLSEDIKIALKDYSMLRYI
jgi:hypothetical protein